MESQVAASLVVLEAELRRLTALEPSAPEALRTAAQHVAQAIDALATMTPAIASEAEPARPRLADRIFTIAPLATPEAFRTKVKLKAIEPVAEPFDAALAIAQPAPPADDLTRIRGIDAGLAARLASQGVASFAAIASWAQPDVRRISDALGLGRQISRQNWIEQAALLAGTRILPASAPALAPRPLMPLPEPEPKPIAAIEATPERAVIDVVAPTVIEHEVGLEVVQAELAPPPAAEPKAVPVTVAPAEPLPPDRLDLITGIDAGCAEVLRAFGVERWTDIAAWRRDDITRLSPHLAHLSSISRQGWIEQAALLASGRMSHHALRVLAGDYAVIVPQPAVEPLPEPLFEAWSVPVAAPPPQAPVVNMSTEVQLLPHLAELASLVADHTAVDFSLPAAMLPEAEPTSLPTTEAPTALDSSTLAPLERIAGTDPERTVEIADTVSALPEPPAPAAPAPLIPPAANRVSRLHVEDEEFPELHVGEADVKIVRHTTPAPTVAAKPSEAKARSLATRFKRTSPLDDIDKATYAGYRDHVEEASVEIIKSGTSAAAPSEPSPASSQSSIRRLLRPFGGNASN